MANQVSGLAGYNFWFEDDDGHRIKQNDELVPEGVNFTFDGLNDSTDYSNRLFVSAVDNAGNETSLVPFTGLNAETLNPTPDQLPMGAADVAAIDQIMARCRAASNPAKGQTIAIVSPKGYLYKNYGTGTGVSYHFRTASQTKAFTAQVILMQLDQGLLSLDDTLDQYYPGVKNGNIITIEQMLMMRSGVFDYQQYPNLGMNFVLNPAGAMTVEQIMAYIKGGASAFTPGTAFQYTNSNYFLLAKVAEAVDPADRPIHQIIKDDILTPLGLLNTYLQLGTGVPISPYSPGYDNGPLGLALFGQRNVTNQNPSYIWASGAMVSLVGDLIKWGQELRDGTLLSPETHNLRMNTFAFNPLTGVSRYGLNHTGPTQYGYGLGFIQVGSWFGHDGSWLGHDSTTMFEPHTGTVISIYENFQTGLPNVLAAMSTMWYEIAEYLYPYSAQAPGYGEGGPFTGGMGATVGPIAASFSGGKYTPASFPLPADLPADFIPSAP